MAAYLLAFAVAQAVAAAAREGMDDAGHGIGAVEHTGRATHDLDAIEVVD